MSSSGTWKPQASIPRVQFDTKQAIMNTLKERCLKLESGLRQQLTETHAVPAKEPLSTNDLRLFGKFKTGFKDGNRFKLVVDSLDFKAVSMLSV